jgi:hypothetical protein
VGGCDLHQKKIIVLVLLYSYSSRGPGKVIKNLKKGLDLAGVEYVENPSAVKSGDKVLALQWSDLIYKANPDNLIIGPNICTLPIDNHFVMNGFYKKIIVPSQWVKDLYTRWMPEDKISVWPVGIDTDEFPDFSHEEKTLDFLVYLKNRSSEVYDFAIRTMDEIGKRYDVIQYGNYSEGQLLDLLRRTKCCVVFDNTESQGIALQEIMSTNVPLVVYDKTTWDDRSEAPGTPATSVPYWDERCGEIQTLGTSLKDSILEVYYNNSYSPREYIIQNLDLKTRALEIVSLFENGK